MYIDLQVLFCSSEILMLYPLSVLSTFLLCSKQSEGYFQKIPREQYFYCILELWGLNPLGEFENHPMASYASFICHSPFLSLNRM